MVRKLRNRLTSAHVVSVTVLFVALAGGTAYGTADLSSPQDGPASDDFSGYIGLAEPGASMRAPAKDGRKAEGLGAIGERTSTTPDVPGEPVEDESGSAGIEESPAPVGDSAARLRAAVENQGSVRLIVTMKQDVAVEAELTSQEVRQQRAAIETRLDSLGQILAGTNSEVVNEFTVVPAAVAVVDAEGLKALLADPVVAALTLDREAPMALDVSTGVIDSDLLNTAGVLGNNFEGSAGGAYEVAILDSGVDNQHNAFTGRIVDQACFSATSFCPNGGTSQIGGAAGDNCTYSTQCDHGTHVGGIAAGSTYASGGHEGVARGSRIVAIQVGHRSTSCNVGEANPCWRYFFSDLDLALQHTLNLRNGGRNIAALNLSLGGPLHTTEANCGAAFPNTQNLAANLQAAGVAVVAAAGNNGSGTSVSYPGCLPSSFTVAATDDNDVPAGFSNNNAITDWWAPGVSIDAPVTSGPDARGLKSGTSMATPHAVGALALLRECVDGNGVPQTNAAAAADLSATGPLITRDGVSRPRINVLDAATRNVNNNDFASPETLPATPAAGGFNDFDFTVCSDTEPGEPGPFSLDNGIWYSWTPSATGTATISTEDNGSNVTTFDTTMAVYTGNTLGGLQLYASDDDSGTGLRSLVVVPVQAGTTYRIKVDGFAAANGLLNLHLENGPPPTCQGLAATHVGNASGNVINGTPGSDVVVSGSGDDTINTGDGDDRVCSDAGADEIDAGLGNDTVFGGPDADTVRGGGNDDTLLGNAGAGDTNDVGDLIVGGPGNDHLDGWVGDDTLVGGPGDDALRGEAGVDLASFSPSATGVTADLAANTATGEGNDTFVLVENLDGSNFPDRLFGDAGPNVIKGREDNDVLNGRGGNDTEDGGFGDDGFQQNAAADGADIVDGGQDTDTVNYDLRSGPLTVTLNATANDGLAGEGDTILPSVENVDGGSDDDRIVGNGASIVNRLRGFNGSDTLDGGGGDDTEKGGANADVFQQGAVANGADVVDGEGGIDLVNYGLRTGPLTVTLNAVANDGLAGEGDTILTTVENVDGGSGADRILGNTTLLIANTLRGGGGADVVRGGPGGDSLVGNGGPDDLFGDAGADALNLLDGLGHDAGAGGADTDTAQLDAGDTLTGVP